MKYINADKLIAEIKRLEEMDYHCDTFEQSVGFYEALDYIKSFLNSLQQEQPNVDLDVEIEKELRAYYNDDQDVYWWNYLKNSFRHFYELGLNTKKKE